MNYKLIKKDIPTITINFKVLEGARVKITKYIPVEIARKINFSETNKIKMGLEMLQACIVERNIVGEDDQVLPISDDSIDMIPLADFTLLTQVIEKIVDGDYEEDGEKKA